MPRIAASFLAKEHTGEEIDCENDLRGHHPDRTPRHELIKRQEVTKCLVVIGIRQSSGKPDNAQNMHRVKSTVQEHEERYINRKQSQIQKADICVWKQNIQS